MSHVATTINKGSLRGPSCQFVIAYRGPPINKQTTYFACDLMRSMQILQLFQNLLLNLTNTVLTEAHGGLGTTNAFLIVKFKVHRQ